MALVLDDRVKETSTTTGTGTLNLSGAVSGFQTFVAGIGDGNTTYYAIVNRDEAEWETGLGTVTDSSTDTLARTTVIASSNSDSAVDFSAGTKDVFCTLPASKIASLDTNDNLTIGSGSAGVDYTLTFDGADSDGVLTWMEDEDLFKFTDVINVGVDDAGHDVKFFGDTASRYWLWDTSADGVVQLGTLTVGVDDAGYDVKFFGNTASAYMLWDTSEDDLVLAGAAGIDLAGDIDVDGTANLDNTDIDGTFAVDGTTISLDATTSLNIDNSNTSNGITIATATSGVPISIGHATSETTVNDNLTVTGTLTGTLATAAQGSVTSLGTLTALTVDDVAIDGKVVTMTGSASDTAVFTAGTDGTLSIVTTDAAAAAANIQITADGTAELAGTTVTLDSAADIELEATDDINVPANVGVTFGNDGEKIEGDGSDLTISGNTVNLDSSMNHTFSSTGKAMVLGF